VVSAGGEMRMVVAVMSKRGDTALRQMTHARRIHRKG
jgi:hypothetical protein